MRRFDSIIRHDAGEGPYVVAMDFKSMGPGGFFPGDAVSVVRTADLDALLRDRAQSSLFLRTTGDPKAAVGSDAFEPVETDPERIEDGQRPTGEQDGGGPA